MMDKLTEASPAPLLVNVTAMDRDRYFESVRARAKNGRNALLSAGGIAAAVIGLFMNSRWILCLGIGIFVLTVLSPWIVGRRDFRRLCRLHPGGTWEKTVRFYPDHLESDAGSGVTEIPYSALRREYESPRMYILDFGRSYPGAALDKSGFQSGSLAELKELLLQARREAYAPDREVDEQGRPCERNKQK